LSKNTQESDITANNNNYYYKIKNKVFIFYNFSIRHIHILFQTKIKSKEQQRRVIITISKYHNINVNMPEICDPITQHGSHYIKWIHMLFGSCVYGNREAASLLLGFLSIACWLNAQSPQLIKNYKNKSTDGLSIQFLMILLLGDVTNLLGCILTKQLPFQTYLSMYFCSMDCALFLQYFYYTWSSSNGDNDCEERKELEPISKKTSRTSSIRSSSNRIIGTNSNNSNNNNNNNNNSSSSGSSNNNNSNSNSTTLKKSINDNAKKNYYTFFPKKKEVVSVTTLFALLLLTFNPMTTSSTYSPISTSSPSSSSSLSQSQSLYLLQSSQTSYPSHDKILTPSLSSSSFENFFGSHSLMIGRVISWICTTLYLTSRMPQIWQNQQRKSVEGLSIIMFICAALGNLTYTMSIFTNPLASSDPLFLVDKIPYIFGAVGTLSFDVIIFLQWCVWKDRMCHDHQYPYRRARSATAHSYSSIGLPSSKRLSSSTHKLGYNTLPSNYHKTNFKKQLRSGGGSSDDIRRSIILTNGEIIV